MVLADSHGISPVILGKSIRRAESLRLPGCYPLWRPCSTDLRLANDFVTPAQECSPGRPVLQPRLRNACTLARSRFRLVRFRSPLLRESHLLSFPQSTEMFQFPWLPQPALCVQTGVTGHDPSRVSPFGHPRINACLTATRGLSQPATSFFVS